MSSPAKEARDAELRLQRAEQRAEAAREAREALFPRTQTYAGASSSPGPYTISSPGPYTISPSSPGPYTISPPEPSTPERTVTRSLFTTPVREALNTSWIEQTIVGGVPPMPRTALRAPAPEVQPSGEQIAHHVPATVEAPARTTHRAQSVAQDIASRVVGASPEQLMRMSRDLQREPSLRALVRSGDLGSDDVALEKLEELLKKLQKLRDAQARRFRQDALVATTAGTSKTASGMRIWTGPTWVPTPVVV